jgi:hypothetical protein
MAPKPKPARFVFAIGIGLVALTLLTAMTWATAWPAFRPTLLLVY